MDTTTIETIPEVWDDERDTVFFRIVARLFSPAFDMGAGVLLASYDDDLVADFACLGTDSSREDKTHDSKETLVA